MEFVSIAVMAGARQVENLGAFQERFGEAFVLYSGKRGELKAPQRGWQPTIDADGRRSGANAPEDLSKILLCPLAEYSTVGRVEPNQVILSDESVSIYHAVLQRSERGEWLLQDAGSKNGTYLNDVIVPNQEQGKPLRVRANDSIRFGSVVVTFLPARELFDLVQVLRAFSPEIGRVPPPALSTAELFSDLQPSTTGARPLSDETLDLLAAIQLIEEGKHAVAIKQLCTLAEREPGNKNVQVWLGVAQARQLLRQGDQRGARKKYREVLSLEPHHEEALRVLATERSE